MDNFTHILPEETDYICKLLYEILKVPICFMDHEDQIILSFSHDHIPNPLYLDKAAHFIALFEHTKYDKEPVIRSGLFSENYVSVSLFVDDNYLGRYIIGPSVPFYFTSVQIDTLMNSNHLPLNRKRAITTYLSAMPNIDYNRLIRISQMLYYLIYNKILDTTNLIEKSGSIQHIHDQMHQKFELKVSTNRMQTFFHHTLEHENLLLQSIREGDLARLTKVMDQSLDGESGILSRDNPLRSQKNLGICMVTLVTRAAIEGGLNSERAFTLSDLYIQELENTHDIKDLHQLSNRMLYDFTNQVNRHKQNTYSKSIKQCLHLISNQLYEPLTLSELAKSVGLSAHYFAECFKKEVGLPVMTYIQKEKIEEAKRLLTSSTHSILEISDFLDFHDQSHFTKTFAKWTGSTPRKYRENSNF